MINSSGESNIIMESQSEDDIRYTSPNTSNVETIQKIDLPRISSNSDFSNNVISLLGKIVSDTKQMTPTLPPTLPPAPPPTNHKDENSDTDSNSSKNTVSVSSRSFTRSVSAGQMVDKGPTTYDAPLTMTQLKEEPTNESIIGKKTFFEGKERGGVFGGKGNNEESF